MIMIYCFLIITFLPRRCSVRIFLLVYCFSCVTPSHTHERKREFSDFHKNQTPQRITHRQRCCQVLSLMSELGEGNTAFFMHQLISISGSYEVG
ncbi:hypothetical protein EDD17DRAFT_802250 [Pisolithus thermaeus]|nr:hypothetical protein EDD17DRAFT_802250 [Pisolithus thermaeus]